MTRDEIRAVVLHSLEEVAPEVDTTSLDPNADIREELDIDSMDFLNFVTAVHEALKVDIPEADYAKIQSVDACVGYLAGKLDVAGAART